MTKVAVLECDVAYVRAGQVASNEVAVVHSKSAKESTNVGFAKIDVFERCSAKPAGKLP